MFQTDWIPVSKKLKPRAGTLWIWHGLGYLPARYLFELRLGNGVERAEAFDEADGQWKRFKGRWASYQKVSIAYQDLLDAGVSSFRLTLSGKAKNQETIWRRNAKRRADPAGGPPAWLALMQLRDRRRVMVAPQAALAVEYVPGQRRLRR